MGADAAERGQSGGHRLVTTVHRHQCQVHVDDEVRLRRTLVQRDLLTLRRLADVHVGLGVLPIVLVQAVRPEGREDAIAHDVPDLVSGHAPVKAERGDEVDVLHARLGGHVDDLLHHELPHVRRRHRRQRERQVVERDRQLHASPQQRLQRIVLQRLRQRSLHGPLRMRDRLERVGRIHDA